MSRTPSPNQPLPIPDLTPDSTISYTDTRPRSPFPPTIQLNQHQPSIPSTSDTQIEIMAKPTRQRSPDQVLSEQPAAKKQRRQPDDDKRKPNLRSSPSSSSQDVPESEMDADRSQQSEASLSPAAPPKKKRTRTLTTPHQSAVLHALLAQSRFPTTAMREEVGRSIGLSARKVQIWFQNQRQKARRPSNQTQSSALLTRPAQYGTFTTAQPNPIMIPDRPSTMEGRGVGTSIRTTHAMSVSPPDESPLHRRRYDPPDAPLERGSQLLGPGMPGSDLASPSSFRGRDLPVPARMTSERATRLYSPSTYAHSPQSIENSPGNSYITQRPSSANTSASSLHQSSFSRTLPPLVFDGPRPHSSYSAHGQAGLHRLPLSGGSSVPHSLGIKNTSYPESPFAQHILDSPHHSQPYPPALYTHPPPPPPPHLRPYPPSLSSPPLHVGPISWMGRSGGPLNSSPPLVSSPLAIHARPLSSARERPRSPSPQSPESPPRAPDSEDQTTAGAPPSARLGRYDPVRAAFIPIRQSTPTPQNDSQPSSDQQAETDDT